MIEFITSPQFITGAIVGAVGAVTVTITVIGWLWSKAWR